MKQGDFIEWTDGEQYDETTDTYREHSHYWKAELPEGLATDGVLVVICRYCELTLVMNLDHENVLVESLWRDNDDGSVGRYPGYCVPPLEDDDE